MTFENGSRNSADVVQQSLISKICFLYVPPVNDIRIILGFTLSPSVHPEKWKKNGRALCYLCAHTDSLLGLHSRGYKSICTFFVYKCVCALVCVHVGHWEPLRLDIKGLMSLLKQRLCPHQTAGSFCLAFHPFSSSCSCYCRQKDTHKSLIYWQLLCPRTVD